MVCLVRQRIQFRFQSTEAFVRDGGLAVVVVNRITTSACVQGTLILSFWMSLETSLFSACVRSIFRNSTHFLREDRPQILRSILFHVVHAFRQKQHHCRRQTLPLHGSIFTVGARRSRLAELFPLLSELMHIFVGLKRTWRPFPPSCTALPRVFC